MEFLFGCRQESGIFFENGSDFFSSNVSKVSGETMQQCLLAGHSKLSHCNLEFLHFFDLEQ